MLNEYLLMQNECIDQSTEDKVLMLFSQKFFSARRQVPVGSFHPAVVEFFL